VLSKFKINEIEDITPGMLSKVKSEHTELFQKYLEQANAGEPYRSQAIMDFF